MSKEAGQAAGQASEINETTSDVSEPIEVSGGDSSVSFDELDRAITQSQQSKPEKGEKKNGKETSEKEKSKEVSTKKDEPKSKEEQDKDAKDGEAADDKSAKPAKIIKVKHGEKIFELPEDLPVDVKVNGETQRVPLSDLLTNYSGKTDWQKKYSEMDRERQTFHKDRDTIHGTIQTFYDLATDKKDPKAAIDFLGQVSGADMVKFWSDFQKHLEPMIEARMKLSPDERQKRDLEEELQLYKARDKRESESKVKSEQENRMKAEIQKIMQDSGMDGKAFYETYAELKASGSIPVDKLKPEDVGTYFKQKQTRQAVEGLLKEVNPDAKPEDTAKDVGDLIDVWKLNPKLTIGELKEIAVEAYGSKAAQNLSRKIKKSEPAHTSKPKAQAGGEPVFFDDL